MTVTALARRCGVSRSTLLHYESLGLLRRPPRTAGNYRAYGAAGRRAACSRSACTARSASGSRPSARCWTGPESDAAGILQRRLVDIDAEIETLRGHQRAILRLLQRSRSFRRNQMITKDKWVADHARGRVHRRRHAPLAPRVREGRARPSTRNSSSSCTSRRTRSRGSASGAAADGQTARDRTPGRASRRAAPRGSGRRSRRAPSA